MTLIKPVVVAEFIRHAVVGGGFEQFPPGPESRGEKSEQDKEPAGKEELPSAQAQGMGRIVKVVLEL